VLPTSEPGWLLPLYYGAATAFVLTMATLVGVMPRRHARPPVEQPTLE
jgi:hypothetical protein